jgi:bifunctional DNA-binding transcriptional regulator/antitoxin component of YhaV-PrlF toxin-antitoxin module
MSKTFITKVIADGRITLPLGMRKNESIEEGDLLELCFVRKIKPSREIQVEKPEV